MPRRTNPFQHLTSSIMAIIHEPEFKVEESVLARNRITGAIRELDILITHRKRVERKILVECRDHRRKQNVQWIDELTGKAQSLNLNKVIAVSSSGFTEPAVEEARVRGIETLHLKEAEKIDWSKWRFGLEEFGVNVYFDLEIKRVDFITVSNFKGPFPKDVKLDDIVFVDVKKQKKCPAKDWVEGFKKDPKILSIVAEQDTKNAINHYRYESPCDAGIGFVVQTSGQFIPLDKMLIYFDSVRIERSVPLKHYVVGDKRILTGELGPDTRLVLQDMEGKLKVMIEQRTAPFKRPRRRKK